MEDGTVRITASARSLAMLAVAVVPLHAQSRLTVMGGYSHSRMEVEGGGAGGVRMPVDAFAPGIGITLGLSDRVGLTAEALSVRKGYSTIGSDPGSGIAEIRSNLDITYAEFPLLLTARYPVGSAQLVVLGGATLGVRVQCAATVDRSDASHDQNDCIDTDRGVIVPRTNVAVTAGFGMAWHRISLVGQYEMTGQDIPGFSPGLRLQHRTLLLMLGFDLLKTRDRH
jgi:hypothetical protein